MVECLDRKPSVEGGGSEVEQERRGKKVEGDFLLQHRCLLRSTTSPTTLKTSRLLLERQFCQYRDRSWVSVAVRSDLRRSSFPSRFRTRPALLYLVLSLSRPPSISSTIKNSPKWPSPATPTSPQTCPSNPLSSPLSLNKTFHSESQEELGKRAIPSWTTS